ncbi:MAG: cyclic nucleotide-binding domain-containing protein [Myxococcales bacterium]|nr:cyclic nucleotide-binding domain-containing protein [Myxococcales bacterium]MCB9642525.1 cyclic nucleotide-binding domain-containing protein [Myxococcales bacterium]
MQILSLGKSDVGLVREHNEDFYLVNEELGLYLVCDGMGGHAAGEVASRMAGETVQSVLLDSKDFLQEFSGSDAEREQLTVLVRNAAARACQVVFDHGQTHPECARMGTTLTFMVVVGQVAAVAHVGDSRLYVRRQDRVFKLTNDHTLVAELVFAGVLTPEQALTDPRSNVLTRAIGLQREVRIDGLLFDLMPGDTYLICSDGLCGSVYEPAELNDLMTKDSLEEMSDTMIQRAKVRDGSDNITTVLLRVVDEENSASQAWGEEVTLRLQIIKQVPLFQDLDLSERMKVMSITKIEHCEAGDLLIEEGTDGDCMYITLEGQLIVTRGEVEIAVLSQGDHVGEMALLSQKPRSASVRAVEPSRLVVIERDGFLKLLHEEPALGIKLLLRITSTLSERIEEINEQLQVFVL